MLKKINYLIIAMIIVIIIIIVIILLLIKNNTNNSTNSDENIEEILEQEQSEYEYYLNNPGYVIVGEKPEQVTYPSIYFSVKACIEKAIKYITENNKEAMYNILNEDYIKNNEITEDNVFTSTGVNLLKNFDVIEIYELTGSSYASFYVNGTTENITIYLNVNWDMSKGTFDIQIISKEGFEEYINTVIEQEDVTSQEKQIQSNDYNAIEYVTMSEEDISRMYYGVFTDLELNAPENAYELLDEEYRNERFGTLENYLEYINEYKNIIEEAVLSKYAVTYNNEYTEYTMVDTYNNTYILRTTSVMNYTIKLDSYTIKNDDYESNYAELSDESKVATNAYIFIEMINTKDYEHAYNVLNSTFKTNNFSSLEEFKEYVKNNFFEFNIDTGENSVKAEGEYYIYTTTIKNSGSSVAETNELIIIIKLLKNTDFEISFSIE